MTLPTTKAPIVEGTCDQSFANVRDAFAANLANGNDLGASLCITVEDETVVDLWGGFADAARTRPWQADTLVNVYSCTKTVSALLAHYLVDQGVLDFDAPVSKWWPEFSAAGKEEVLLRHVMSHSAGLADWDPELPIHKLYDWEAATKPLAAQAPAWPPGSACGYHSLTQGYLIGEVIRRATGETPGTLFRRVFGEPLDLDFYIGLPESEDSRVAELVIDPRVADDEEVSAHMLSGALDVRLPNTSDWRRAEIPAAGGIGNARSLATLHCILANDGVTKGKRFLSSASCKGALVPQVTGTDRILDMPITWGLGFAVGIGTMPNPGTIYWGGYGGSLVLIDMDARTTFAYAMNQMASPSSGDTRALDLAMEMWTTQGLM
ncbi:MAG: beta-lactamase family protein [Pseudomonadales bacterium]|nr:beta-lactamase family protein [Pseudomonadales bacterium]